MCWKPPIRCKFGHPEDLRVKVGDNNRDGPRFPGPLPPSLNPPGSADAQK